MTDALEHLYERARQLPRDARAPFIEESCGDDDALRDELISLLAHADSAEQFFDRLGGAVRDAVSALDRPTARQFESADRSAESMESMGADTPTSRDPMLGRTIGRYQVLALLGRGGMATVYRAHDQRLARDVALKFLSVYRDDETDAARRFLVEARAAAALVHPNVCTVHEIGETDDGRPFIAMTLYEGETLKQRLRRGPVPPREAATIARQLASALGAAHARGIVHRDMKPGNVMLSSDGLAKLLDFGLAQVNDASITAAGATPGTIAYMSPEQARGDSLDQRSDLWSLGVVLYEMLAGVRPFRGGGDRAVLQAIAHDDPEPLAVRQPTTPLALQRIVERLLRKAPDARYADAAAVEADLDAALATPLAAPTTSSVVGDNGGASAQPRRRKLVRRFAAAMAVTVVTAVLASAAVWSRAGRFRNVTPAPNARSLAVLPFVEMSADSADRYFADGLSEEITTALGRIEGLRVAARSSAFALRDHGTDVRTIAGTLGVDAVLEGSVRRLGRQLRVTAQLVDAKTGMNIWSGGYDREASDALTVQDDIAREIAGALELRGPYGGGARLRRGTDLAAYDLYLRALELRNNLRADALQRATELLDRAIELQPDFAEAYAAKASVIAPRVLFRQVPREQGLREVRGAIAHAFALDANLGEAHVSLGLVQLFVDWDWAAAERSLRRAIDLDPNNPHAWQHLGNYLTAINRPDEAITARLRGLALDPLNARLRLALANDYLIAGRLPEALAAYQRGTQLDPLHPITLGLGEPPHGSWDAYLIQGREADAVRDLLRVATLRGASAGEVDSLRTAFTTGGMHGFWQRWLVMDRRQSGASIDPYRVAALSAMAGDTTEAVASLERAYSERNMYLIFMRTEPAFAGLRTHPRFLRIERQMHFP